MTNGSAWAANSKMGRAPRTASSGRPGRTGLTLTDYRYRGLVTFVSDEAPTEYMHLFTATGWTGTPHPCDEGELAWIKKAELRGLPMWEGDKIFLRLLEENVPFFSLKLQYQGDRLDRAVLNGRRIV